MSVPLLCFALASSLSATPEASPSPAALSAESTQVLADFKLSVGKLENLAADVELVQIPPSGAPTSRRFRLAFRKPFAFSVRNVEGEKGAELYYKDGRISLHFPDTGQVLRMDLDSGDSSVSTFFQLFTLSSFVEGTALHDIEGHFATRIFERDEDYVIELTPHATSVWGWALGLARVDATLGKKDLLPHEIVLHESKEGRTRETARMKLSGLAYNSALDDQVFDPALPPGTRELDTYDVLLMWVQDMMIESGAKATDLMDTWQGQLGDYLGGPWVPR